MPPCVPMSSCHLPCPVLSRIETTPSPSEKTLHHRQQPHVCSSPYPDAPHYLVLPAPATMLPSVAQHPTPNTPPRCPCCSPTSHRNQPLASLSARDLSTSPSHTSPCSPRVRPSPPVSVTPTPWPWASQAHSAFDESPCYSACSETSHPRCPLRWHPTLTPRTPPTRSIPAPCACR
jgi:hypothetical protein